MKNEKKNTRITKLIKERIALNWKPIVTFRNHIHKSIQVLLYRYELR